MGTSILIIAELKGSTLRRVTLEALGVAAALLHERSGDIACFLAGSNKADLELASKELARHGAHHVYVASGEAHQPIQALTSLPPILSIIKELKPQYIIAGHTAYGRELAPRLAAELKAGYIADIISMEEFEGQLQFTRPIYAGKAFETRTFHGTSPHLLTIRPNNFAPASVADDVQQANVEPIFITEQAAAPLPSIVKNVVQRMSSSIDLTEAEIVVAGGRGVRGSDGFKLLQALADELGGAVGASRAACDAGYCDYSLQIGQTGKVVTPQLYIACGISGAIQHLAGMSQSRTIVAINKDPDAPIFSIADYGIVGDLFEVVPLLTAELKALHQ